MTGPVEAEPARIAPTRARAIARVLLAWYRAHRRDLPWRRTQDPYAIWVSEAMLQQTQVTTVEGYFARWMERFPTLTALADSSDDDVLHAWQGLGYYSRAKNLRRAAELVVRDHGGRLPKTAASLRSLPGVGPYSAGAIASIAHGERVPVVDGNVVRVLCRLFCLAGDPTRAPLKNRLWQTADALVPGSAPGDFNQALMELGATVCSPRAPNCRECPLAGVCEGRKAGKELALPELPKRRASVAVSRAAAVVRRNGKVLVVRVPTSSPKWGGFWTFPSDDVRPDEKPERAAHRAARRATGAALSRCEPIFTVRHSVTHHRITLDVFRFDFAGKAHSHDGFRWCNATELDSLALPSPDRRIARRAFESR